MGRSKTVDHQNQQVASDEEPSDAGEPREHLDCMICNVAKGWAFLEEQALISSEDIMDMDSLVDMLIQVSLTKGMPPEVRCAMHSIAFILDQLKAEAIN